MPRIEVGFHSHPKIIKAGNAAVGLYVRALSYCWDHKTEGHIPLSFLKGQLKTAERCVLAGLFDRDGDSYQIHDYLGHNYSREQREEYASSRRAGGRARWKQDASTMLNGQEHHAPTVLGIRDIDDKGRGKRVHSLTDRAREIEEGLRDPGDIFPDRDAD